MKQGKRLISLSLIAAMLLGNTSVFAEDSRAQSVIPFAQTEEAEDHCFSFSVREAACT